MRTLNNTEWGGGGKWWVRERETGREDRGSNRGSNITVLFVNHCLQSISI